MVSSRAIKSLTCARHRTPRYRQLFGGAKRVIRKDPPGVDVTGSQGMMAGLGDSDVTNDIGRSDQHRILQDLFTNKKQG